MLAPDREDVIDFRVTGERSDPHLCVGHIVFDPGQSIFAVGAAARQAKTVHDDDLNKPAGAP